MPEPSKSMEADSSETKVTSGPALLPGPLKITILLLGGAQEGEGGLGQIQDFSKGVTFVRGGG